jgi:AhpD family alkylhydroperoxidase
MYQAFVQIPWAIGKMIKNHREKRVDKHFIERLQLAVTEVNGCAACSYAHTYLALKQGMSNDEISSFLNGDGAYIHQDESRAIVFAQHFADARGFPKKKAYNLTVDTYGEDKAKIILAAVKLMHAGNIYGIPYSALLSRLKGNPYRDSSLAYEVEMHIAGFLFLPIALIHGTFKTLLGFSNIDTDDNPAIE